MRGGSQSAGLRVLCQDEMDTYQSTKPPLSATDAMFARLDTGKKLLLVAQADKRYQLADWRTRPLPEDMLKYARMDTHYLLYIYDRLKVCCTARHKISPESLSD